MVGNGRERASCQHQEAGGKHSLVCDETGRDGHPSMCHEIGQNSQQPVNMIMIGHGWS